jgi:chemotaxis protein methyltransferase CheR
MSVDLLDVDVLLFQDLICRKSGILLEGGRLDALRAGLAKRMASKGFASPSRYYSFLRFHPDGQVELEELLSYITINETYFFRNKAHFAALRDLLIAKLVDNNDGVLNVWSAGCSTGEEPYSIAMMVLDILEGFQHYPERMLHQPGKSGKHGFHFNKLPLPRVEILGTDVDKEALAKAERGIYGARALRVAEEKYRGRYFKLCGQDSNPRSVNLRPETDQGSRVSAVGASGLANGKYEIYGRLRDIVSFRYQNLMETPYPKPSSVRRDSQRTKVGGSERGSDSFWDIIFCRNVVIYFNREALRRVAGNFHNVLADDGYLFMGHSETLDGISEEFSLVEIDGVFVYVKRKKEQRPGTFVPRTPGNAGADASVRRDLGSPSTRERRSQNTGKKLETQDSRLETAESREPLALSSELRIHKDGSALDRGGIHPGDQDLVNRANILGTDVPSHAPADTPAGAEAEAITRAAELYAGEQVDAALSEIEKYMKSNPGDARGHLLAGKIYADGGIYERAVDEFEKAVRIEPLLIEARCFLGFIYEGLGETARAIEEFKKSVYIDKDCVLPYFRLACIYQAGNMRNDALREFRNTVGILEGLEDDEIIPFSGGYTVRLLRQICLEKIEELK